MGIFAPIILFLYLAQLNQWGDNPLPFIPFVFITVFFIVLCSLFYKLTVELDGSTLKLTFGIGLIKFKFNTAELEHIEIIKTPWYYGLGIRVTPKGTLYNIQGSKAVMIKFRSKGKSKSILVGSPEPAQLKKALVQIIKK